MHATRPPRRRTDRSRAGTVCEAAVLIAVVLGCGSLVYGVIGGVLQGLVTTCG